MTHHCHIQTLVCLGAERTHTHETRRIGHDATQNKETAQRVLYVETTATQLASRHEPQSDERMQRKVESRNETMHYTRSYTCALTSAIIFDSRSGKIQRTASKGEEKGRCRRNARHHSPTTENGVDTKTKGAGEARGTYLLTALNGLGTKLTQPVVCTTRVKA